MTVTEAGYGRAATCIDVAPAMLVDQVDPFAADGEWRPRLSGSVKDVLSPHRAGAWSSRMFPVKPPAALVAAPGFRQQSAMEWREFLRSKVKAGRKRGSIWVRLFDIVRLIPTAEGRANLWTRIVHGAHVHQTSSDTAAERYPALFDLAAGLAPNAERILSFGCSTGEELVAIRRRFPAAEIVGVEINSRSRRIAASMVSSDGLMIVVGPDRLEGSFDVIFALAVLQREPHKVAEMEMDEIGGHYPFERFDAAVSDLAGRLRPGAILCVVNAHYPIELSTAASQLEAEPTSPAMTPPLFGRDGRRLGQPVARTIFRKHFQHPPS